MFVKIYADSLLCPRRERERVAICFAQTFEETIPGACDFLPAILMRNMQATTLITTFTKERNRVKLRILSNAAQELAFLIGFEDQTDLMVKIHKMSMTIVITFKMIN